jgi:integrase
MSIFRSKLAADLEEYLEFKVAHGRKSRSQLYLIKKIDKLLASEFPEESILTKDVVLCLSKQRGSEGPKTQAQRIGALRGFAEFLQSKGAEAYIAPRKLSPRYVRPTPHILTDDELTKLFCAIDEALWPANPSLEMILPVMFRLIYTCGLRPSEGRTIKLKDVDVSTGEIMLRKTKGYKERVVVMSEDMRRELGRYIDMRRLWFEDCEWLFPGRDGKHLHIDSLARYFTACWEKAGIAPSVKKPSKVQVYSLRHRFASAAIVRWMDEGKDVNSMLPVLQAYLGHDSLSSTAYYVHILPENVSRSAGIDWAALIDVVPEVTR